MGATPTTRLGLNKQLEGDLDWHTALDSGFDDADANLLQVSSLVGDAPDPNPAGGAIDGKFVGQLYIDETPGPTDAPRVWVCESVGVGISEWRLLSTNGVESPGAGHGGNTLLESILADYQSRIAVMEAAVPVPPRGMIDGLTLSWVAFGAQIGVAVGEAADLSKTRYLERSAAWTKLLNTWSSGNGAGGVSSSVWAADGDSIPAHKWYHVFLMWSSGMGHEIGFDDDVGGANLKADHSATYVRRIGSWKATAANLARKFTQTGDYVAWHDPGEDNLAYSGTGLDTSVHTATLVTPLDVRVRALLNIIQYDPNGGIRLHAYGVDDLGGAPETSDGSAQIITIDFEGDIGTAQPTIPTNLLSQIKFECLCQSGTVNNVWIATKGYIDPRGKDQ